MTPRAISFVSAALLLAAPWPALAAGPTFDCSKASHEIEILICKDDALAAKDRELAEIYGQALEALASVADGTQAAKTLKAMQRGWIGGRNECWKSDDKHQCTEASYETRIAELQARYYLIEGGDPVFYTCENNPANEIVATFIPTRLPTARLERGDTTIVAWLDPSASGSKYVGEWGVSFWIEGDDAQVEWPQGTSFSCRVRR